MNLASHSHPFTFKGLKLHRGTGVIPQEMAKPSRLAVITHCLLLSANLCARVFEAVSSYV